MQKTRPTMDSIVGSIGSMGCAPSSMTDSAVGSIPYSAFDRYVVVEADGNYQCDECTELVDSVAELSELLGAARASNEQLVVQNAQLVVQNAQLVARIDGFLANRDRFGVAQAAKINALSDELGTAKQQNEILLAEIALKTDELGAANNTNARLNVQLNNALGRVDELENQIIAANAQRRQAEPPTTTRGNINSHPSDMVFIAPTLDHGVAISFPLRDAKKDNAARKIMTRRVAENKKLEAARNKQEKFASKRLKLEASGGLWARVRLWILLNF